MGNIILTKTTISEVKKSIFQRKISAIFLWIWYKICDFFCLIGRLISGMFKKIYCNLFPKRFSIQKLCKKIFALYIVFVVVFDTISYFVQHKINFIIIALIPIFIVFYIIIKLLLWIYSYFIGDYQLLEQDRFYTRDYIIHKMPHLLKPNGETGAGKDTIVTGIESVIVDNFRQMDHEQLSKVQDICYIIDFELLEYDLFNNYKQFLSFSREKIEANFIGSEEDPGIARERNMYIKRYYFKKKKITTNVILNDYYNFKDSPLSYGGMFSYGVGVNKKHYLQLIMEDYIPSFIRIHVERNYIMSNQPKIENMDEMLMAKMFNFNFLRSKTQYKMVYDKATGKKERVYEKVLFPWKNKIIIDETEADTWWGNRSEDVTKEIIKGGIRDTKAYNRHYIDQLYWFQVGQAAERTNLLMRELEQGYLYVYSRSVIDGGKKMNLFLSQLLTFHQRRIQKFENKKMKLEMARNNKSQKLEDLKDLFIASSNDKYKKKIDKIEKKLKPKEPKDKYYKSLAKISKLQYLIEANKKDGYIMLNVHVSKSPEHPAVYEVKKMKDIMHDSTNVPTNFVGAFVFKISECEKYDTRYMRSLAEERAQKTTVEYAEVARWPTNLKMGKEEAISLGYLAVKDMYGITDQEQDDIRFNDGYDQFKIEPKIEA